MPSSVVLVLTNRDENGLIKVIKEGGREILKKVLETCSLKMVKE